jgi:hypothetical protein
MKRVLDTSLVPNGPLSAKLSSLFSRCTAKAKALSVYLAMASTFVTVPTTRPFLSVNKTNALSLSQLKLAGCCSLYLSTFLLGKLMRMVFIFR